MARPKWGGIDLWDKKMIIIGFSGRTTNICWRVMCRRFRHVAPIVVIENKMYMYQFEKRGQIKQICVGERELKILGQYGWEFIYMPSVFPICANTDNAYTCVDMTKQMIGIKNIWVQTPYRLYKMLIKKYNMLKK